MSRHLSPPVSLALMLAVLLAGCDPGEFILVPVSGRILVDGKPVPGLRISFEPAGTVRKGVAGPQSIAITDEAGSFRLKTMAEERWGAIPGPCRVRIWTLPSNQTDPVFDDRDPNYDDVAEIKAIRAQIRAARKKVARPTGIIPFRFNDKTELTFTVPESGTDSANFDISWK